MNYILYNPLANKGKNDVEKLAQGLYEGDVERINVVGYDVKSFLTRLTKDDAVFLCGGDGTVNHFANDTYGIDIPCPVYLVKSGTGNDFLVDIGYNDKTEAPDIREYLVNLPNVEVKNIKCRYINGIGYGIDGQVCQEADFQKAIKPKKDINYTAIAIKLLLFKYKAPNAKVTVDGVTKKFEKVWIASAMKGRYYGGGMQVAPAQDRNSDSLSVMVMHGGFRLKALMIFPGIFTGKHVKHKEMVEMITGNDITVEFDRPTALQIDGETVRNVSKYHAYMPNCEEKYIQKEEKEPTRFIHNYKGAKNG